MVKQNKKTKKTTASNCTVTKLRSKLVLKRHWLLTCMVHDYVQLVNWLLLQNTQFLLFPVLVLVEGTSDSSEGEASDMVVVLTRTQETVGERNLKTDTKTVLTLTVNTFLLVSVFTATELSNSLSNTILKFLNPRVITSHLVTSYLQMFHLLFSNVNIVTMYLNISWIW